MENDAPIEDVEVSTENISAEDGGVTTTPEEVEVLLGLKPMGKVETTPEEEEDDEPEAPSTPDAPDAGPTPDAPKDPEIAPDAPSEPDVDIPTFELEVEDVNGEKFTLKPGDDLEEVLKDFEPKSNGQIFAVLEKLGELKSQKAAFEQEQATKAEESEKAEQLATIQSGWDKEIESLQGAKRLEVTTDGKNERVDAVFKYMNEENDKRIEDGRPLIRSFEDALDKLELIETKTAAAEKAKEEKELARKRGSLVGGSSAPATSGAPVYKGGARNANDAMRQMGILK